MTRSLNMHRAAAPVRGWPTALALVATFCSLVVITRLLCKDSVGNSSFWPSNGALVAILMLLPRRFSLVAISTCVLFNLIANSLASFSLIENVLFALMNVLVSVATALLARRFCGAATDLSRVRRLAVFALISVVCSAAEASMGECVRLLAHATDADFSDWIQWTLCDSLGLIICTPAILLVVKRRRYASNFSSSAVERLLLVLAALGCTFASFLSGASSEFFFIYPLLILVAFRAGPVWVLFSVASVAIIASAFTAHGFGPLAKLSSTGPLLRPDVMQPFLVSLLACALPANNALNDSNRAANRLERLNRLARRAKIEALSANAAKSQFIANISHEIRTPLNGVLGMAQALASSDLSSEQRGRLDVIRGSGEVLLGLLNDVLDFSKIEAGRLELEHTSFMIQAVAASVADTFSAVAEAKGVKLFSVCSVPDQVSYFGDPTRIRQVVTNLVSNALKFTQTGHVAIRIEERTEGLMIEVADTGIGIPVDKLGKLFGKFEQADASTTREFGGTGLGLSISSDLVRLMSGSLEVTSTVGSGSTFTVILPLERRVDERVPPLSPVDALAPGRDQAALRILAAEDNPTNQLVLRTLLGQVGLEPVLVDNGAKAVEEWRRERFDVILMDMQMPVMDGLAAATKIRALEAETGAVRTPIIAFTANVMSHQIQTYLDVGIDAVVAKPIEFAKLLTALDSVLAGLEAADLDDGLENATAA